MTQDNITLRPIATEGKVLSRAKPHYRLQLHRKRSTRLPTLFREIPQLLLSRELNVIMDC